MRRVSPTLVLLVGALVVAKAAAAPHPRVASHRARALHPVVSCPFNSGGGDDLTRGFYIKKYPAKNIAKVTLEYGATTAGTYKITLTARKGTYAGPKLASPTASVVLSSSEALTPLTFTLRVAVSQGSTVTFMQSSDGPGTVFYNTGKGHCGGVIETAGTQPPLSKVRGHSVGLRITASKS